MKLARWLLPVVSLLAVVWFTWLDVRDAGTGPGPLHSAHADVAALERGARCEACHRPGEGVDAQRCTACHAVIGAQVADGTGLHGSFAAEQRQRCEHCHGEHHGDDTPLIAPYAFARAGVADAKRFDHAHVAFGLHGAHEALACARCHPHADATAPPAGGRFVGLSQQCTACHRDAHAGAFGAACEDCHGQQRPFAEAPHFDHAVMRLDGAHAQVPCATCHGPGTERDVAAERRQRPPARACKACHADPHGGAAPVAALRLHDTGDCARCHDATAWRAARPTLERHAALGFALHGAHAAAACTSCHGDASSQPRWSGPVPGTADCGSCHTGPHREAMLAAARCEQCHVAADATFAGSSRITADAHAAAGFPLVPPHAALDCNRCHRGTAWHERFPGRDAAGCTVCHADAHGGQFDGTQRRQCTDCHERTHFTPHRFGRDAHARTAFPLTGAHEAVACMRCHTAVRDGVRTFAGTPSACAACHADVHAGAFDGAARPAAVGGRSGCARCHDTSSFTRLVAPFDHLAWTGHALAGAHERVACAACHPPADGRRLGKAAGTACASCHADPHAGQFRTAGATDCARCHDQATFAPVRFDHQRDTRFPLDGAHRDLACSRCHVAVRDGERTVVRYRPLGTACADCHRFGNPPQPRGGR
jgi:hypothetical protein